MQVGLITQHGNLTLEFANPLRARGKNTVEAVIEAASPPESDESADRSDEASSERSAVHFHQAVKPA